MRELTILIVGVFAAACKQSAERPPEPVVADVPPVPSLEATGAGVAVPDCPSAVNGATVQITADPNTTDTILIDLTAPRPGAVGALRQSVARRLEALAPVTPTPDPAPACFLFAPPGARLSAVDVDAGSQVRMVVAPIDRADVVSSLRVRLAAPPEAPGAAPAAAPGSKAQAGGNQM